MPKMKTNRAAAKRFSVTGSGKIKRNKGFKSHLLSSKGKKRKRHLRQGDHWWLGRRSKEYSQIDTVSLTICVRVGKPKAAVLNR